MDSFLVQGARLSGAKSWHRDDLMLLGKRQSLPSAKAITSRSHLLTDAI